MHLQPLGNNSLTMISNEVTLSKANHKTFPNNQIWLADRKQAPRTHVYRSEQLTAGHEKCQSRACGGRIYRLVKSQRTRTRVSTLASSACLCRIFAFESST